VEPAFLAELCPRFGPRVIVAVDAREGRVAVKGWVDISDLTPLQLAHKVRGAGGVASLLYTDISRDGTEQGPNVAATAELARGSRIPVLASGGVGSVDHIAALAAVAEAGIEGVVVGRALYTGAVTLPDAIRAARGAQC
jgi:phosphoribosylformimino-5-aminoimidazole carboxamide ribotide isomerase